MEASKTNWSVADQVKLSFMFTTAAAAAVVYKNNKMVINPSVVTTTILSYHNSVYFSKFGKHVKNQLSQLHVFIGKPKDILNQYNSCVLIIN